MFMGQDPSFSCSVHLSSLDDALSFLAANGQEPLLQYLKHLPPARQKRLVASLAGIDLNEFSRMRHVVLQGSDVALDLSRIEPVPVISRDSLGEYESVGEETLRQGKCAALTVAGGLGSRLGFDGPKGCFSIMPLSGKSLFAVFAERIQRYGERFGFTPYWFIMTSDATHQQTQDFFETHKFWGLDRQKVFFFRQGCFPVFDQAGHLLLAAEDRICFAPNGHGGVFEALAEAGLLSLMREKGIEYLSYFQVDNPLVRIFDARFLGYHLAEHAEISTKVVWKRGPDENVGVFARVDGRTT
ncbi:MAG: UDPGP type 1 family protein, partial [Lentisphaerae bacterium]